MILYIIGLGRGLSSAFNLLRAAGGQSCSRSVRMHSNESAASHQRFYPGNVIPDSGSSRVVCPEASPSSLTHEAGAADLK